MAKELFIDPTQVRSHTELTSPPIAVNAYQPDLQRERERYGEDGLLRIARDMILIREFELMLDGIKKQGSYQGVTYNHLGPAHLSIGQEAAAVGQAFPLRVHDKVFGSHRSHGEVIAKGLSTIATTDSGYWPSPCSSGLAGKPGRWSRAGSILTIPTRRPSTI